MSFYLQPHAGVPQVWTVVAQKITSCHSQLHAERRAEEDTHTHTQTYKYTVCVCVCVCMCACTHTMLCRRCWRSSNLLLTQQEVDEPPLISLFLSVFHCINVFCSFFVSFWFLWFLARSRKKYIYLDLLHVHIVKKKTPNLIKSKCPAFTTLLIKNTLILNILKYFWLGCC